MKEIDKYSQDNVYTERPYLYFKLIRYIYILSLSQESISIYSHFKSLLYIHVMILIYELLTIAKKKQLLPPSNTTQPLFMWTITYQYAIIVMGPYQRTIQILSVTDLSFIHFFDNANK